MNLKKSYFNRSLYKNDLKQFWWISLLIILSYLVVGLLADIDVDFFTVANPVWIIFMCFGPSLIGVTIFAYLHNEKNNVFTHSLPITRLEIFNTKLLSGITIITLPQILVGLAGMIFIANSLNYNRDLQVALINFIALSIIGNLSLYLVSSLTNMITGYSLSGIVLYHIFLGLPMGIFLMISSLLSTFINGYQTYGRVIISFVMKLSPATLIYEILNESGYYNAYYWDTVVVESIFKSSEIYILIGMTILIYCITLFIYKKRHLENSKDFITVKWLKPVFSWGVGICFGLLFVLISENFAYVAYKSVSGKISALLMLLIGSLVGFIIADSISEKAIFNIKKRWKQLTKFAIVISICLISLFSFSNYYENYIPEKSDIEGVSYFSGYNYYLYDDESIEIIMEIHEKIVESIGNETIDKYDGDYDFYYLSYVTKEGKTISRSYLINIEEFVTEMTSLYNIDAYKKQLYPILSEDENLNFMYIGYTHCIREIMQADTDSLSDIERANLIEAMKKDIEEASYYDYSEGYVLGRAELSIVVEDSNYRDGYDERYYDEDILNTYSNTKEWALNNGYDSLFNYSEYVSSMIIVEEYKDLIPDDDIQESKFIDVENTEDIQKVLNSMDRLDDYKIYNDDSIYKPRVGETDFAYVRFMINEEIYFSKIRYDDLPERVKNEFN